MSRTEMPPDSVRGRIRKWIKGHLHLLGDDVLEVGSKLAHPDAWWCINRDLARGQWTGMDIQEGEGVDVVGDVHALPAEWTGRFSGVLCSEVLEHVARPWIALPEIFRVIRPGGHVVVTTLTTFHVHGYPDDYYRYTESGLRLLLSDAGFQEIEIQYGGDTILELKNYSEKIFKKRAPLQIFAVGRRPDQPSDVARRSPAATESGNH